MSRKQLNLSIDAETEKALEVIAESAKMKPSAMASLVLATVAEIEPREFFHALGDLKTNYPRRGPGRPPARARTSDRNAA